MTQTTSDEMTDAPSATTSAQRAAFNSGPALEIADALHLPPQITNGMSSRFAFFADETRLAVVAGAQEGEAIELALAYAVRHANGRATTLVLPENHMNATAQRVPWLKQSARPAVHIHRDGSSVMPVAERSQADTVHALVNRLEADTPEGELAGAMKPLHLNQRTDAVWRLVEHVTRDRRLDHGHRRAERSWHYAGQRVLSIRRKNNAVAVTAGIHYGGADAPEPVMVADGERLTDEQFEWILEAIEHAIEERRDGPPPIHRPDEHWLQAIIRRDPSIVGVEQPALRELPAWRPRDSPTRWGRGFIDLAGLDGHGDIRIVETKLADNADDLLVLQGLDYYVWATAYEHALRQRLGAANHARFELHYVLGANATSGKIKVSPCTKPLADALDPEAVRWRFQTVRRWYKNADDPTSVESNTSELFEVLFE